MKKIKNLLFIITIALVGFIGINNANAAENYGLFVNGEEFTSEKTTINCGEGTATFDNSTKTLTLNNASIKSPSTYGSSLDYNIKSTFSEKLTITLVGENTIRTFHNNTAIKTSDSLLINGTGKLTIKDYGNDEENVIDKAVINVGNNLTIVNATINAKALFDFENMRLIYAKGYVNTTNATINAESWFLSGITADDEIELVNSNISFDFSEPHNYGHTYGIHSKTGIIINNSNVTISANIGLVADGIFKTEGTSFGYGDTQPITIRLNSTVDIPGYIGDLNIDEFYGVIVGLNQRIYTKEEFKEVLQEMKENEENSYDGDLLFGDFETYSIYGESTPDGVLDVPNEGYEGEIVFLNNDWNWYAYELSSVKILKASDNTDVSEEVNLTEGYDYDTSSMVFTMPNYPVKVVAEFKKIYNEKPSKVTAKFTSYNGLKLTWSSTNHADGYDVYYRAEGYSYKLLCTTSKLSCTKASMLKGKKYFFKVVPYTYINDYDGGNKQKTTSTSYKAINVYTLKKMTAPTVTKYNNSKVKVKWTKINGPTGYEVYRSMSQSSGYKLLKRLNRTYTSYTFTTVRGVKYYYKVRAYKLVDGKRIYAPFSNIKTFTLK